MSILFMIGNGFDLAAGLKTKYSDFVSKMWKDNNRKYSGLDEQIINAISRFYNYEPKEKNYTSITLRDYCINYKISFWEYLLIFKSKDVTKNYTWINFEEEIKIFLDILSNKIQYVNNEKKVRYDDFFRNSEKSIDFESLFVLRAFLLAKYGFEYLEDVVISEQRIYNYLLEELKILERMFQKYLLSELSDGENEYKYKVNVIKILPKMQFKGIKSEAKSYYSFSFNYTTPFSKYCNDFFQNRNINVHGCIDTNIIFGIDDTYLSVENYNTDLRFLFTKTFRRMEGIKYGNNTFEFDSDFVNSLKAIKIFGLSLGQSDYVYFQTIFDAIDIYNSDVVLEFFYYEYDKDANEQKKIAEKAYQLIKEHSTNRNANSNIKEKGLLNKLLLEKRLVILPLDLDDIYKKSS